MMNEKQKKHWIVPYGLLVDVWFCLMALTAATVAVSRVNLGSYNTLIAVIIAGMKTGFVVAIFMHVKFENRWIQAIVLFSIFTLAMIFGLTFSDYPFR